MKLSQEANLHDDLKTGDPLERKDQEGLEALPLTQGVSLKRLYSKRKAFVLLPEECEKTNMTTTWICFRAGVPKLFNMEGK